MKAETKIETEDAPRSRRVARDSQRLPHAAHPFRAAGRHEQTDSGKTIAVVDYNGFRIVIPLKEMMVAPSAASSTDSMAVRQMKLLGNMLARKLILSSSALTPRAAVWSPAAVKP